MLSSEGPVILLDSRSSDAWSGAHPHIIDHNGSAAPEMLYQTVSQHPPLCMNFRAIFVPERCTQDTALAAALRRAR